MDSGLWRFWEDIAPGRRRLGFVVAVVLVGLAAGLLLSSVSAAASPHSKALVRSDPHVIRGGPGNDLLRGGAGNDVIYGGAGNDRIYGGSGKDVIYGGPGNDVIFGGPGNDVIYGGPGNDRIVDTQDPATVFPGSGTNTVDVADGRGDDRVVCAAGSINHVTADPGDQIAPSCLGKGSTLNDSGVSPETWMHDLAPYLGSRRLSDIVIPGSHDTGTYGLIDDPISLIGKAQTEDITHQLNDGIREFDIRVGWNGSNAVGGLAGCSNTGYYYVVHGALSACSVKLQSVFDQIEQWANKPGHEQEILLVSLQIDQHDGQGPFPTGVCQDFARDLGSALLTPSELYKADGITDPGQVTLGKLWSMPGHPRVIMSDNQCMDAGDPSAGKWSPDPPFGSGGGQSYYANECYADPYTYPWGPYDASLYPGPGIRQMVLAAARTRATDGPDATGGYGETRLGSPMVGGLWTLFVQATPSPFTCLRSLADFDLTEQENVLSALYQQWLKDRITQTNLNIVSGDFVQDSNLVKDAIAMDGAGPVTADKLVRETPEQVGVDIGWEHSIGDGTFAVEARYQGRPVDRQLVNWSVSPAANNPYSGADGPNFDGSSTAATQTADIGLTTAPTMDAGPHVGTWKMTASIPGTSINVTWTIVVVRNDPYHFGTTNGAGDPYNPATVPVNGAISGGLKVQVLTTNPYPSGVAGRQVTFDATGGAGAFADGSKTATVTTKDGPYGQGVAISPPLRAGTLAGPMSVSVSSPDTPTLPLPLTVTTGPPNRFVPTSGDLQSTPINTTFPIPLTGHYVDQYGNVITNLGAFDTTPGEWETASVGLDTGGTSFLGSNPGTSTTLSLAPDGTVTAPPLRAGHLPWDRYPDGRPVYLPILVGKSLLTGWQVQITPGPPAAVTATGGDGQQTGAGQRFAQPLAVKVTDAAGNAIPGAPVTFMVTSGAATFPPLSLLEVAVVTGHRARTHRAEPPRVSVAVPTDANGIATAPILTAGPNVGPIEVTATSSSVPSAKSAVFHLSATGVAPTPPTITNLGNGDGQVTVGFSGASAGTSPITSYDVSATDVSHAGAPPVMASGPSSPIVVKGLTNGDTYQFTVTATSVDGTSSPSAPSGRLNVGVPPVITSAPADGALGKAYSSGFKVTGAPPPTVTLVSGDLPPGLTLGSDGTLTGTPTKPGPYDFTVQAISDVGIYQATVPVTISPANLRLGAQPLGTGWRRHVNATICTRPPGKASACASLTLSGTFLPLGANTQVLLARGTVTYAVGRATARYGKLTLQRRRQIPAGRYTLILRRGDHAIILPVTVP